MEKLEAVAKRFGCALLNEAGMNFRNVILQNLFRVVGLTRARHPKVRLRCTIVEFFNKELEEQLEHNADTFKKTTNLKSLLNMGVCMNGRLSRVPEQGPLGRRHLLVPEVLHGRGQGAQP